MADLDNLSLAALEEIDGVNFLGLGSGLTVSAFVKSLGTGFRDGFNFKDISVINDKLGKPSFFITKKIKKMIKNKIKTNRFNFFLSISDEKKYSIAFVILQK